MTVVSPNPDFKRMQSEIEEMLGLNLESESLVERAEMLRARMSADCKRYLIILADVSKILNLEEVGIPCVDVDSKRRCKIIWMSQLPNVFSDMRTQSNFNMVMGVSICGRI
ncbi:PREDICTED: nucleotide-binding site leucine-rich repeat [Prunus dulcis]|uniref:PREDICTED: nucleotide-binding site leucine-rich repeat n=1 Tax=Prunus dulcis TaxID=3755 RepID=A0A5E4FT27_PRUDU|nr:hypothetical protein L3X38_044514 [Prunus dulcis]VVA30579.1 PREDICTED: nucleotide-binding site leucine-rich repeat [Prunus dulcis]